MINLARKPKIHALECKLLKVPKRVSLSKCKSLLILAYENNPEVTLSAEYLRVYSPSAENKGNHSFPNGKQYIQITDIAKCGNYALRISFSDDHTTGIFTWSLLLDLSENRTRHWDKYLSQLHTSGKSREPHTFTLKIPNN
ncbi:MAG: 1-(5-phosphoribosyl)-5-((5-phosphoribosylamino)methylideneamino)imidazole-4-carboxamide isomerase [Porticoccaceae bacterium]|nr:1-(5-phosphoribosyl)-5-((5-phosphoribosylamino)methylideneamino)imidazole-4-carboxamide isomerase [Porticoccaceae bacterium]